MPERKMPLLGRLVLPFLLLSCAAAHAQPAAEVFVDIGPCMRLQSDAQRHACYDRLEERVRTARVEASVSSANQSAAAPTANAPAGPAAGSAAQVTGFGMETPSESARIERDEAGESIFRDRIAALEQRQPNRWLVTLDSGQIWYQDNSKRLALRPGMEITIYPSPFGGAWRLSAEGLNGFIQVRRVR